jgi:hypothetical protein
MRLIDEIRQGFHKEVTDKSVREGITKKDLVHLLYLGQVSYCACNDAAAAKTDIEAT